MRRLLLIFLLVLLPLQASWAAVCAYCPGGCIVETDGTPDRAGQSSEPSDTASVLVADDDCSCCQLGGVGITSSLNSNAIAVPHALATGDVGLRFASIRPDRPERPKWLRAA